MPTTLFLLPLFLLLLLLLLLFPTSEPSSLNQKDLGIERQPKAEKFFKKRQKEKEKKIKEQMRINSDAMKKPSNWS